MSDSSEPLSPRQNSQKSLLFLISVVVSASLTAIHFGYVIANINVAGNLFNYCDEISKASSPSSPFNLEGCFKVSTSMWGFVGSSLPLGGLIGSLIGGSFVKAFGLQKSILLLNVPLLVGYLLMAFSTNIWMLIAGRLLQGFVCGLSGVAVPSYISAVTPHTLSGTFVNFFQLFLVSGVLVAEVVSYWADLGRQLWLWRFGFGAGVLFCAAQFLLFLVGCLPKTPLELEESGRIENARLLRLKLGFEPSETTNMKSSSSDQQLPKSSESEDTNDSVKDLLLFKCAKANKSLILGLLLHAGQQISGVNAVFFYSTLIFSGGSSGKASYDDPPTLIPIILALVNVLSTFVAIWLLKRTGRRPVALFSSSGSAVCLFLLAFCMRSYPSHSVFPMIGFIVLFAVGLGPVPWLMMPEIFPPKWSLTIPAISACISANWVVNIFVTGFFPMAADKLQDRKDLIFGFFGLCSSIVFVALYFLIPETRNRLPNFI